MFNRKYKERIAGEVFVIPIINGRKTYSSEPWMTEVIKKLFDLAAGSFIDVGVNLGQTMLKVAAADRERTYVGFEPNPACADYAFEVAKANNLPFSVIPAALGPEACLSQLQIYRPETTDPSASLIEGFRKGTLQTKPVVTLAPQNLPREIFAAPIAIVKIDVEGGEANVLQSLAPYLDENGPFILLEILPYPNSNSAQRLANQQQVEKIIADRNYAMFRIIRDSNEQLRRLEEIDEIGSHTDLASCDYIMAPRQRAGALQRAFEVRSAEQKEAA